MNVLLYSGYLNNIPMALEEGCLCGWSRSMADLLEDYFSKYETDACNSSSSYSNEYLE